MIKVGAAIKKALEKKEEGIISGAESMLAILRDLQKQITIELGKAALGSWDAYHLRQLLDSIEGHLSKSSSMSQKKLSGLLDSAWRGGIALADSPSGAGGIYTGFHLSTSVLDSLKEYSNDYLKNLYQDAWYKIKGEINLGVMGSKTPQEVMEAIGTSIDAGRFKNISARAEIITRNEMGAVFSKATQMRMEQAAGYVPGMEKQWIHAGHPKMPRHAHVAADGQHVPVAEPFKIGGVKMMFPRDPGAPLEEIINCGCDHVPFHANWA
jgi:hypothetical protein